MRGLDNLARLFHELGQAVGSDRAAGVTQISRGYCIHPQLKLTDKTCLTPGEGAGPGGARRDGGAVGGGGGPTARDGRGGEPRPAQLHSLWRTPAAALS